MLMEHAFHLKSWEKCTKCQNKEPLMASADATDENQTNAGSGAKPEARETVKKPARLHPMASAMPAVLTESRRN